MIKKMLYFKHSVSRDKSPISCTQGPGSFPDLSFSIDHVKKDDVYEIYFDDYDDDGDDKKKKRDDSESDLESLFIDGKEPKQDQSVITTEEKNRNVTIVSKLIQNEGGPSTCELTIENVGDEKNFKLVLELYGRGYKLEEGVKSHGGNLMVYKKVKNPRFPWVQCKISEDFERLIDPQENCDFYNDGVPSFNFFSEKGKPKNPSSK